MNMISVILFVIGIIAVSLLWVMLYDTTHFEINRYRVGDPRIRKSCRAVVLADLHNTSYGRGNEVLLEAIRNGNPDFVLIAGDLLTAAPGKSPETALALVNTLAKEYPIYYGNGNHEHRIKLYPEVYGDLAEVYAKGLADAGVSPLVNAKAALEEYGICVTGAEIGREFYRRFQTYPMEADYLTDLLGECSKEYYTVLLAHNPDYFSRYAQWGADLVLSGHVHGGVVRIPFWNRGIVSTAVRLFPKYDGGIFTEGESTMLLSRGLGSHTIPFRLFNPGELIFVDFEPGEREELRRQKKSV